MDLLAEFKGQNGILYVYEDCIEISRKTLGGISSQGGKGDRKIHYTDITAIEYKSPNLWGNGYFKVVVSGTKDIDAGVGILSSSMKSMKDPNTIILRAFKKSTSQEYDRVHSIALNKFEERKKINNLKDDKTSNNANNLEDLKKLGELLSSGVLTNEEFQREKEKLLT